MYVRRDLFQLWINYIGQNKRYRSCGVDGLVEGRFRLGKATEAFLAQKVVDMLREVLVGGWEILREWWKR